MPVVKFIDLHMKEICYINLDTYKECLAGRRAKLVPIRYEDYGFDVKTAKYIASNLILWTKEAEVLYCE